MYKIAEREAAARGKELSQSAVLLLRILAAKYRAGLHPHLELIARYIGQEHLNSEVQLEGNYYITYICNLPYFFRNVQIVRNSKFVNVA